MVEPTIVPQLDSGIVDAGRAAWRRIRESTRATYEGWREIGEAIIVGRQLCMEATHSRKPQGRRYSDAMAVWLRENDFIDIPEPTRCEAVRMAEDPKVDEWHQSLPEYERIRLNHPRSVIHGYGAACRKQAGITKPQLSWKKFERYVKAIERALGSTDDPQVIAKAGLRALSISPPTLSAARRRNGGNNKHSSSDNNQHLYA
jgi:hypothetical protein